MLTRCTPRRLHLMANRRKGWSGHGMLAGNMGNTLPQPSLNKACARAAGPKSRALEADASGLNGRHHGAWGSSAVFVRWRSRTSGDRGWQRLTGSCSCGAVWTLSQPGGWHVCRLIADRKRGSAKEAGSRRSVTTRIGTALVARHSRSGANQTARERRSSTLG